MTDAELSALIAQLAPAVGRAILADGRFENLMRAWMKELVLATVVEQEELREFGEVRSFLAVCRSRGLTVRLGRDGRVWVNPKAKLTQELAGTLLRRREAIADHLLRERELLERRAEREAPPAVAGKIEPKVGNQ